MEIVKKLIGIICLLLIVNFGYSQIVFEKFYGEKLLGENASRVAVKKDGGFLAFGFQQEGSDGDKKDYYLINTDSKGDTLWTKVIGGNLEEQPYDVIECSDRNIAVFGWTKSFGAGNFDCYLVKLNPNGDILFEKTIGTINSEEAHGFSETSDGGFIMTGALIFAGGHENGIDLFAIKTDSKGDILWNKTIGGIGKESGHKVLETKDCGYIIAGNTSAKGNGKEDIWFVKLDIDGNTIWDKTIGGAEDDKPFGIAITKDGGIVATGETQSFGAGQRDIFVAKVSQHGDSLWFKTFGDEKLDKGVDIIETKDGGLALLAGTPSFGAEIIGSLFIRMDKKGDSLWTYMYKGKRFSYAKSIKQIDVNNYILCGSTFDYNNFNSDFYLAKLNKCTPSYQEVDKKTCASQFTSPSGKYTWTKNGSYTDTLKQNSGCDSVLLFNLTLNTTAITNSFESKNDSVTVNGKTHYSNVVIKDTIKGTGCDSIVITHFTVKQTTPAFFTYTLDSKNVTFKNYSDSTYSYKWKFGDSDTSTTQNPNHTYTLGGDYNVCLTITNSCTTNEHCINIKVPTNDTPTSIADLQEANIKYYPNPTSRFVNIELAKTVTADVLVKNVLGKTISTHKVNNNKTLEIEMPKNAGIYMLDILFNDNSTTKIKVIKN